MRVLSKLDDDHDEYGDDVKIDNTTQITPSHTYSHTHLLTCHLHTFN